GTEGAQFPFWSADGSRIGFYAAGRLKSIPTAGGPAQIVAETAVDFRGGAWGPEDIILYTNSYQPMSLVNSAGEPTPITTLDASRHEGSHRYPQFLPDGHHFLYSILSGMKDETGIYVGSLDGKVKKHLINVRSNAVYVPPGYILFVDGDTLMANGFDPNRL